ncbi:MAG: Gfo/Idh/MocA family oxidoreductase [bacterium]
MERVRVAIIGSKFSASLHIDAYKRLNYVDVIAVAAIDNLEEFGSKHNISNLYSDYKKMLERNDIDLVSVCVPNFLHCEVVKTVALSGKKNIICEKPLATNLENAKEMISICEDNGVRLMYSEDWLFAPALVKAKNIIKEGAIGDVLYIKAKECHPGSHSQYARKLEYCGGGSIIHLAIHPIGLVRWLKEKEVVEVIGKISKGGEQNLKHSYFEGEDWGCAILTLEDNTQAFIEGNYITCGGLDNTIEIYGTTGTIKIKMSQGSPISVFSLDGYSYAIEKAETTKGWTMPAIDEEMELGYPNEIAHFTDCVRKNQDPSFGVRAIDGLITLEIVQAIYKSSKEGKSIKLPL